MAAEISEITERNHPVISEDTDARLEHILTDLHEALRLLAKHDEMLECYRPLLERFAHPLAAGMAARKERRQRRGPG